MEFKGTKGEWSCKKTKKGHYKINGDDWNSFCKVYTIVNGINDCRGITQANAKLIASAPDLLELCLLVYNSFGGGNVITFSEKDIENFKQAIEKALK